MNRTPTKAEYRKLLNEQDTGEWKHRHDRYHQRTRKYGDYLYYQDRVKFEWDYAEYVAKLNEN